MEILSFAIPFAALVFLTISDVSRQVTKNWTGYITVKRAKILLNFGRIEGKA